MAMPRPSSEAQEIAEKVIPGINRNRASEIKRKKAFRQRGSMSPVEVTQTSLIERK